MARRKAMDFESLFVSPLSAIRYLQEKPLRSDSVGLNTSMGSGGLYRGSITLFYGPAGSGKTTAAVSFVKNALKQGLRVLWVAAEDDTQPVNMLLKYVSSDLVEKNMRSLRAIAMETVYNTVLEALKANQFDFVVIDSISALIPEPEMDADVGEKSQIAAAAKRNTEFLRKVVEPVRTYGQMLLLISQVRANLNPYGKQYVVPGGQALRHIPSSIVFFSKKSGDKKFLESRVVTEKSRYGRMREMRMIMALDGGIDPWYDFVENAKDLGVLQRVGQKYVFTVGEPVELARGYDGTVEYLKKNQDVFNELVKRFEQFLLKEV